MRYFLLAFVISCGGNTFQDDYDSAAQQTQIALGYIYGTTPTLLQVTGCDSSAVQNLQVAIDFWNSKGLCFEQDQFQTTDTCYIDGKWIENPPQENTLPVSCVDEKSLGADPDASGDGMIGVFSWAFGSGGSITIVSGWTIPETFAHELGHSFGLLHEGDEKAVMYPTVMTDKIPESATDMGQLCSMYPKMPACWNPECGPSNTYLGQACQVPDLEGSLWPDQVP